MLLTIVAALTIGFSGCSDELSGDQTQGKPGYLTVNVKTLKSRSSKVPTIGDNDYKIINDLNVFIFDGNTPTSNMLQHKFLTGPFYASTDFSMQVGTLTSTAKVVVVANYGSGITGVTKYGHLTAKEIETVRDFTTLGLHMTGEANISGTDTYTSYVNIAPVESKITVNWTLAGDVDANYVVTGVYVVNAINKTTLPIIRQRSHDVGDWTTDNASDIAITGKITLSTKTASYGFVPATSRDYNFYSDMTDRSAYLKDELAVGLFTTDAIGTYITDNSTALSTGLHYYVGENYHADLPAANGGGFIANATLNANTIVVVRVTPKSGAPAYIKEGGHKYYTYDFSKNSSAVNAATTDITDGFSVRRKTNYNLTFALTEIGASAPFVKLNTLNVYVTADPWEDSPINPGF